MANRSVVWCPHKEGHLFLEVCKSRCKRSRRLKCASFQNTIQLAFDFGPVKENKHEKDKNN
jgi:hypothetical protein